MVVEGCPAFFGDNGSVGVEQPNYGFDKACGAVQNEVEFMPDIADSIVFDWNGRKVKGGLFLQSYELRGGKKLGSFDDGRIAVVQNKWGKGSIMLIGTYPSHGYYQNQTEDNRSFFDSLLPWAGKEQILKLSNDKVQVRLRKGDEGTYLWAINPTKEEQFVEVTISGGCVQEIAKMIWGDKMPDYNDGKISLSIHPQDSVHLILHYGICAAKQIICLFLNY